MNTAIAVVRAGTRPHAALLKLSALAGQARQIEWQRAIKWRMTPLAFKAEVLDVLVTHRLIFCRTGVWNITDAGLSAIDALPDAPGGLPGQPQPAASQAVMASLSRRFIPNFRALAREGSFDFRDIPSRMNEHVTASGKR